MSGDVNSVVTAAKAKLDAMAKDTAMAAVLEDAGWHCSPPTHSPGLTVLQSLYDEIRRLEQALAGAQATICTLEGRATEAQRELDCRARYGVSLADFQRSQEKVKHNAETAATRTVA
jgi:hypothetical protein